MPINISDVVVNIGQISQINWIKDALLPFASVFLGAILAHKLNIHREQAQKIDELCAKMNIICNKSDFLLGNLMSYNEFLCLLKTVFSLLFAAALFSISKAFYQIGMSEKISGCLFALKAILKNCPIWSLL